MKNISNATVIFRYGQKSTRRVDLVGDYAGKELFLLDGDSLLLKCFSDPQLDFDGSHHLQLRFYHGSYTSPLILYRWLSASSRCMGCRKLSVGLDTKTL